MNRLKLSTRGSCLAAAALLLCSICNAATAPVSFNIEAQRLDTALTEFAQATGLQLLFPTNVAMDQKAPKVSGSLLPEAALQLLLKDSGLSYQYVNANTVAIRPTRALSSDAASGIDADGRAATLRLANGQGADAGSSAAQEDRNAASGASSQPDVNKLDEIVVTAQKRSERLQDTPMSISALSARDIERRGLVNQNDYLRSVPAVSLIDNGPGINTLVIRGAYGEPFSTGPTVGVYLADVPLTGHALGGSTDIILTDIERVEVLRGPQGTLYGSNSLSGTVRYIPHAPNLSSFEGDVEAGYSMTDRFGGNNTMIQGVVNVPLVNDKLAVRAVVYRHDNEGFYRNVAGTDPVLQASAANFGAQSLARNDSHTAGSTYTGGRITALWKPIDRLAFTLTYLTQNTSQEDRPFEQIQYGAYRLSDYQFGGPGAGKDALEVNADIANFVGELDLGWGKLLASSSWIEQEWVRIWDIGSLFAGRPPITQLSYANAKVLAHELRLSSSLAGPFQFIAGAYYEDSKVPYAQPTFYVGDPARNPFGGMQMWDSFADRKVLQKAAFGELSLKLGEHWAVVVGGRAFDYDTRFIRQLFSSTVTTVPNSASDTRSSESGTTLKAGMDFKPTENALMYARFSQGFRLGRPLATSAIASLCDRDGDGLIDGSRIPASLDRVSSDSLESYELGGKLTFMEGRATLNAAVYSNDWTDIPVNIFFANCLTSTTINGGSARARGGELEGTFRVTPALRLGFGFGYVDSFLTSTTSAGNDGDRMNFTPELNGNVNAEYGFTLLGRESFVRGDYMYFGDYYTGTGERGNKVDAYGLVSLNAGMRIATMDVQLQISNLLGSDAFTTIGGAQGGFPGGYALRVRPRTVGVTLQYNF